MFKYLAATVTLGALLFSVSAASAEDISASSSVQLHLPVGTERMMDKMKDKMEAMKDKMELMKEKEGVMMKREDKAKLLVAGGKEFSLQVKTLEKEYQLKIEALRKKYNNDLAVLRKELVAKRQTLQKDWLAKQAALKAQVSVSTTVSGSAR
jgi:hypothetical protein